MPAFEQLFKNSSCMSNDEFHKGRPTPFRPYMNIRLKPASTKPGIRAAKVLRFVMFMKSRREEGSMESVSIHAALASLIQWEARGAALPPVGLTHLTT